MEGCVEVLIFLGGILFWFVVPRLFRSDEGHKEKSYKDLKKTLQTSTAMSVDSGREQTGTFTRFFWTVFETPFGFYLILLAVIAIPWSICTIGPSIGSSISAVAYGLFSAKGPEMTTSLTCQRIEPSLPVTCEQEYCTQSSMFSRCSETQMRSFELLEARVQKPKGEKYFWVQILTDKDIIDLAECNNDPTITECAKVSSAINKFVKNREHDVPNVLGKINIKIEDDHLMITY